MNEGPLIVGSVAEVAAVVPHVLGFDPTESLVVFPTRTGSMPVARVDMPRTAQELGAAAESIGRAYAGRGGEVVLLAYTNRPDLARDACERLADSLEPDTRVLISAAIEGDNWVRLDRAESGTIRQGDRDLFTAEFTLRGQPLPASSQDELRATFDAGRVLPSQLLRQAQEAARVAAQEGGATACEQAWMTLTFGRVEAARTALSDVDAARLIADVQHMGLRDHAWASMDAQNAGMHAGLWKDLLSRSPEGTEVPTASLTAFAHWLNGQGAHARIALERVPDSPPYSMAVLVGMALESGMDPKSWSVPAELRPEEQPPTPDSRPAPISGRGRRREPPPQMGHPRDDPSPRR